MVNVEEIWKKNLGNLLGRARSGDAQALGALRTHYDAFLREYVQKYIPVQAEAEKAVQGIWEKITENPAVLPQGDDFETWLKTYAAGILTPKSVQPAATQTPVQPVVKPVPVQTKKKSKVLPAVLGLAVTASAVFGGWQYLSGRDPGGGDLPEPGEQTAQKEDTEKETKPEEKTENPAPTETPAPTEEPVRNEPVIWADEPGIAIDEFEMIAAPGDFSLEYTGYPLEWNGYAQSKGLDHSLIAFRSGRTLKITTFDRQKTLLELDYGNDKGLPYYEWLLDGYISAVGGSAIVWFFSDDFTSAERSVLGGIGGWWPPDEYDSASNRIVLPENGGPVINANGNYVYLSESTSYDGKHPDHLYVADSQGYVFDERDENYPQNFVNGFYTVRNKPFSSAEYENPDTSVRYGLKRIDTGEAVTEPVYEEVMYYADGYCPVKKNGKWGFVDEHGNEVTDFIWDNVSGMYQGKCYVGINGIYGILDLKQTLDAGIPVTQENAYPSGVPQAQPKEDLSGPIGTLTVKVTNLNSRSGPGTTYDKLDKVKDGQAYDVYEFVHNPYDGYTWYRIGKERWIADDSGKWVSYTSY